VQKLYWIGLCSVLRPHQHSIGYTGDGFYRSKDPTNSIKVLKESRNCIILLCIRTPCIFLISSCAITVI